MLRYKILTPLSDALPRENVGDGAGAEAEQQEERSLRALQRSYEPCQLPVTLRLEGGVGACPTPAGHRPPLLGHPPGGKAGGRLPCWGCSSRSARDAARSRTGTQGSGCRREQGRTRRLLWARRGGGSNAAGARRHFAGDAREGSPIPGKERCSDSPRASLGMLRRRCRCPGMQCLASVRVTKGDAAVLPASHLS